MLGVVALLGLAACGIDAEASDRAVDPADVPFALLVPPTTASTTTTTVPEPAPSTTSTTAPVVWALNVFFVRSDRLVPVRRSFPRQPDLTLAIEQLGAGPLIEIDPLGTRTALGDPPLVRSATATGGVATVELEPAFRFLPGSEQVLALGQLVFTLTEVPGVGRIAFRIGGADIAVPLPDGQLLPGSVSRDDFAALLAAAPTTTTAAPNGTPPVTTG